MNDSDTQGVMLLMHQCGILHEDVLLGGRVPRVFGRECGCAQLAILPLTWPLQYDIVPG